MSSRRKDRLLREMKIFESHPAWGITCTADKEAGLDILHVKLCGPKDSPYEGGVFKLVIKVPISYPLEPPEVKFVTPIYHPNIHNDGRVCLNMLAMPPEGSWSPTITIETLLISIQTLLAIPNADHALMMDANSEYRFRINEFKKIAKKYTMKYAT